MQDSYIPIAHDSKKEKTQIALSFGFIYCDNDNSELSLEDKKVKADSLLYTSKKEGRNRITAQQLTK